MATNGITTYPPDDQTDNTNADAGHCQSMSSCVINSDTTGSECWNNDAYSFITGDNPTTCNPSLWRQSKLCLKQGLFAVCYGSYQVQGIYQVRGLDISNMTIVECPNTSSVVVIDPLCSVECAREAWKLYDSWRPNKVIKAMIYTHSHGDHFGGAQAIIDAAKEQGINDVKIYAPDGFLEHAVSENVYAGNAMSRRALYMYGESLLKNATGQIGTGLGMATSTGTSSLIPPTVSISATPTTITVDDDLEIICQITPGTEAPSEMNFFFPHYNALCMAENATHTMHNIQTLRGAVVRDARVWSKYLDEAIVMFGNDTKVVFASHHWPTFDNDSVLTFLSQQRDLYAYLHNETLRQLNAGQTGLEIAEDFQLPTSLDQLWNARGYYGSVSHNVKAIYNRYMGWFDGNPAHLWEHPPVAAAQRYIQCIGTIEKAIQLGNDFASSGDLRFAATLLSHCVFADQNNTDAKTALAAVFTSLGYGAENATWRNFYLAGAQELTGDINPAMNAMSAESMMALDLEQLMDTLAIRINGPEAWETVFTIDIMVTFDEMKDVIKSGWHLNMSNGALTGHAVDYLECPKTMDPAASLTFWATHQQLVDLITSTQPNMSSIPYSGDPQVWDITLAGLLTGYDTGFAIVTPEKPEKPGRSERPDTASSWVVLEGSGA